MWILRLLWCFVVIIILSEEKVRTLHELDHGQWGYKMYVLTPPQLFRGGGALFLNLWLTLRKENISVLKRGVTL